MAKQSGRRAVLPLITAQERKAISLLPRALEQTVDVSELSWEDRERVLRLLFAKINNSEPMQQLPPHLLDLQDNETIGVALRAGDEASGVSEGDRTFLTTGVDAGLAGTEENTVDGLPLRGYASQATPPVAS